MSRAPRIPDAQWEVHKGVIESLYLEQSKTIKEIQVFMEEKHQFHATKKQYIRKVTVNWKLRKNTTKEEWEQASALVLKRKAEGKPTELIIHDKIIPDKKRKKELRRYAPKNLPGSPVLPLLETVAARTPPTANRNITYFTIPWLNLQAQLTSSALRGGVYSMLNGTIESSRHSMISSSPLSQNQVAEEHLATSLLRSIRAGDVPGIDSGETISSMLESLDEQIPCGYSHRTEIQSQQTPITESWSRLFFSLVFLSTNNRLEQQVLVNFLKLAISHKLLLDLKQALSVQGPTMRLFSVALLSTALDIPDEEGLQLVRYLLQQGVNPNTVHASRKPLWRAVSSGRKEAVRLLLDHGADPFATFPSLRPCSPSQMKLYNSESLAEALIDQRHNITWDRRRNESILLKAPIFLAVEAGDEPRVRHLLQVGADPNFVDPVSLSLLHVAVRCEDAVQVHLLVEFGADPDIFSRAETMKRLRTMFPETFDLNKEHCPPIVTPLQLAVEKGQLNVARQLLQGGANPDGTLDLDIANNREEKYHQESFAFTALQIASKRNKYGTMNQETAHEIVELLLRAGAGVDTRHVMQSTALQHVCDWRPNGKTKMKTVNLLLEWGADVNALPSQENGKSSLEAAAEAGDIDLVTMLLRRGADCSNSTSLLRAAVRSDGKGIVNFLLDHFSKAGLLAVDMADNWGEYLEIAAKSGNIQVLNMILKSCVDTGTNRYEKHVINAMEAATECNEYGVLGRLLMTGVNPDTDGRACRILSKAIRRPLADENDTSCFTLLMSKFTVLGLDLNKPLPGDATPLWTAIRVGDAVAAQCLIFSGIDVNTPYFCVDEDDEMRNVQFERPMAQAISRDECMHSRGYSTCLSGDFECACWVEFLLTNGANVDCLVDKYKTALLLALEVCNYEAAETLLKHGANPNAEDLETRMDAFDMIYRNDIWPPFSTFKSLIDYGYQINAKSDNGTLIQFITEAHPDASSRDYDRWEIAELVVSLLLDSGAAVNTCATEEHPMTALQYAIDGNRKELTNILLAAGADIHVPAFWKKGKTTLQAACYAGNLELVKSLVAQGLDINAQPASHYGATALQFAAMQGHFNIATFLLENGALINAPAALVDGRTALQGAAEHGRLDMIYLLLENDQDDGLEERCEDAARFAEAESRFEIAQLLREYRKV